MARNTANDVKEELETDNEALIMDQEDALQKILAEFGKGDEGVVFTVRVTRVPVSATGKTNQPGAKETFLFDCDQSEVPGMATKLRDVYGSGVYRARIKENNKLIGAIDFHVEAPPNRVPVLQDNNKNDTLLVQLIEKMDRRIEALQERILTREAPPQPAFDPMAMLNSTVGVITSLQNAIPKPENNMIDIFKLGIEMGKNAGGESGETGVMDVLKSLAEKIDFSKLSFPMQQNPQPAPRSVPIQSRPVYAPNGATPGAARPANPVPQPQPENAAPGVAPEERRREAGQPLAAFAPQLALLVSKAARGGRAEVWADVMDEELPDPAFEFLMSMDNQTLLKSCADVEPRILQYQDWFIRLIECLREIWESTDEAEPDPALLQPELHDPGRAPVNANGHSVRGTGNGGNATPDESVARQGENLHDH